VKILKWFRLESDEVKALRNKIDSQEKRILELSIHRNHAYEHSELLQRNLTEMEATYVPRLNKARKDLLDTIKMYEELIDKMKGRE
jgi:hypothetical protein